MPKKKNKKINNKTMLIIIVIIASIVLSNLKPSSDTPKPSPQTITPICSNTCSIGYNQRPYPDCNCYLPTPTEPDYDGDGIPDIQDLDDDNDGWTDIYEQQAGTNPLDANSHSNMMCCDAGYDYICESGACSPMNTFIAIYSNPQECLTQCATQSPPSTMTCSERARVENYVNYQDNILDCADYAVSQCLTYGLDATYLEFDDCCLWTCSGVSEEPPQAELCIDSDGDDPTTRGTCDDGNIYRDGCVNSYLTIEFICINDGCVPTPYDCNDFYPGGGYCETVLLSGETMPISLCKSAGPGCDTIALSQGYDYGASGDSLSDCDYLAYIDCGPGYNSILYGECCIWNC